MTQRQISGSLVTLVADFVVFIFETAPQGVPPYQVLISADSMVMNYCHR